MEQNNPLFEALDTIGTGLERGAGYCDDAMGKVDTEITEAQAALETLRGEITRLQAERDAMQKALDDWYTDMDNPKKWGRLVEYATMQAVKPE